MHTLLSMCGHKRHASNFAGLVQKMVAVRMFAIFVVGCALPSHVNLNVCMHLMQRL